MFDQLIETRTEAAETRSRRPYFVVSALAVGLLAFAGVIFSIFAADFSIGNARLELDSLLAPVEVQPDVPPPPKPRAPAAPQQAKQTMPTRVANMSRVDEPTIVPKTISVTKNTTAARPDTPFTISKVDSDPPTPVTSSRSEVASNSTGRFGDGDGGSKAKDPEPEVSKPPVIKDPPAVKPPPVQSLGVINGRATYLPKPNYPPAAIAVNATGQVNVQVLIDERGNVISATAISGHPLLKAVAEAAARQAKFSPTLLSQTPVKVTGVITYNFNRG